MDVFEHDAQSARAIGGNLFEQIVARVLNTFVSASGMCVVQASKKSLLALGVEKSGIGNLIDYTRVPVKSRCDQNQVESYPDTDLFVLSNPFPGRPLWRLVAVVSCKVSFHSRHTESAFWGLVLRISSGVPFVVVTEDRDISRGKPSELGVSCTHPSAARRLLEGFTDGIYLVKRYYSLDDPTLLKDIKSKQDCSVLGDATVCFDDPETEHHTKYCRSVRPLDDLVADLRVWRDMR